MLRSGRFALVVYLLTSGIVFGQNTPNQQRNRPEDASIRGKVVVPNNRDSDPRIEVRLERTTLQVIQTTYTDASGNFTFGNLVPGSYSVLVNLDGYEPVRQSVELGTSSFGGAFLTILMNKPAVQVRMKPTGLDAADPDVVDITQIRDNLPKKAVQDYEKALDEKEKGRAANAVRLLEEAVRLAPAFFHAHNDLGVLYQSMKRYAEAETEFKRSRELNGKTDRPLVNIGSLYIEEAGLQKTNEAAGKLLDQALDALEAAVKLNPRSSAAYFLLGQANYKSAFLEEAEAAFRKARELDPKLTAAQLMLANVYVKQQRWSEVIQTLDAYLNENSKAADRARVEQMRDSVLKSMQASGVPR